MTETTIIEQITTAIMAILGIACFLFYHSQAKTNACWINARDDLLDPSDPDHHLILTMDAMRAASSLGQLLAYAAIVTSPHLFWDRMKSVFSFAWDAWHDVEGGLPENYEHFPTSYVFFGDFLRQVPASWPTFFSAFGISDFFFYSFILIALLGLFMMASSIKGMKECGDRPNVLFAMGLVVVHFVTTYFACLSFLFVMPYLLLFLGVVWGVIVAIIVAIGMVGSGFGLALDDDRKRDRNARDY